MRKISQKPALTKAQREHLLALAPLARMIEYRKIQACIAKKKKPMLDTGYGLVGG
jgi:hypothetical protein